MEKKRVSNIKTEHNNNGLSRIVHPFWMWTYPIPVVPYMGTSRSGLCTASLSRAAILWATAGRTLDRPRHNELRRTMAAPRTMEGSMAGP